LSASVKTYLQKSARTAVQCLPFVALIFLFAFNGASAARASEKGQEPPESLITQPSFTALPPQPEMEQTAPENLLTAPTFTSLPVQPKQSRPVLEKELKYVDMIHSEIVRSLLASAVWMDSFFADPAYVREENRSYTRFRYEIFKEERSGPTFKPAFDLRLALPALEEKTHLVIAAEPAVPPSGASAAVRTPAERFGTTPQNTLTTGLQYVFRSDPQVSSVVRTGLQFSKFSPVILIAPRYQVLMPYEIWAVRFTQEAIWRSKGSWQTDTRFDFERQIHELFFRTTVDGVWAAQANGYAYGLSFALRQPLTPTHAIDYEWINSWNTRPVGELTEVAFRVRYRHSYLRDWLFFEVAPQVRFPRDANFDSTLGILFRFEIFFGRT
jgi:hypothetical protein